VIHLFFEFHGRSVDNERGIASGHNDPDLTEQGREEALAMGERYRDIDVRAVHCSDLLRSRRTAEIAFGARGIPIVEDARLRECDYGRLNGAPVAEVHGNRAKYAHRPFPGGESFADAAARVRGVLADLKLAYEDCAVVVIGHSATYFALEHILHGRELAPMLAEPWVWKPVWRWEADL
jgi:broad specificity phosphatase PhoE